MRSHRRESPDPGEGRDAGDAGGDSPRWLLVAGIVLVALNLRPALASVGPVVPDLRADTGLSNTAVGLLTTLPLLAFGGLSIVAALVGRRVGVERALAGALLLVAVGTALRGAAPVAALYLGTGLLGIGVAFGNVLLPALAKREFPRHSGPITSLYSSMMGLGATAAAGLSVPVAGLLGWRGALAVWVVPALVALLVWAPQLRRGSPVRGAGRPTTPGALRRSPLAWQIALYMGLQSLSFYVVIAWLPDLLQARGLTEAAAGWLLALSQATGILGTALIPLWAGRRADQRAIVWTLGILELAGLAGLLFLGSAWIGLCVALLGFILGGTFGLALTFLVLRAADAESAGALSGLAQSVGYLVAATGPTLFGLLHDRTGGWTVPLLFLVAVLGGKVASGIPAGRPRVV